MEGRKGMGAEEGDMSRRGGEGGEVAESFFSTLFEGKTKCV